MCSRAKLNEITQRLSIAYKDVYGADLVKVILYGSYARGDNREDSDVDIVGIVKGSREELQEKQKPWRNIWKIPCKYKGK